MPNAEHLLELADFIERDTKNTFDMGTLYDPEKATGILPHCGTAACIAGHGGLLWPQFVKEINTDLLLHYWQLDTISMAMFLEITTDQKDWLFFPEDEYWDMESDEDAEYPVFSDTREKLEYSKITRKGAIATLRRFATTGTITWLQAEQI